MFELGPYHLLDPLAKGEVADVWRATHDATDTPVAVKVLRVVDPSFVSALHGEAAVLASFRSPYVAAVHDFGTVDAGVARASGLPEGAPWLATEWVPHGPLTDAKAVADWSALRRVLLDVLLGLAHAHARGVLHREVKPGNLLIATRAPIRVKLADFGVTFARDEWLRGGARADDAPVSGYAAPEQVRGERALEGPWTDLYLVGCVAWFLASGVEPWSDAPAAERGRLQRGASLPPPNPRFDVPDGFDAWLGRLLRPRPQDRFLSAPAALDALLDLDRITRLHRRHWSTELDPESPPPHGDDDPGPGVFANRRVPLVGRVAERDRLWSALYDVTVDGTPRAIGLHGPSGVGTSALGAWLVERALETGVATTAAGSASAPSPLAALLADRLGGVRDPSTLRARLELRLGADGEVDALTRWLSGEARPGPSATFPMAARLLAAGGPAAVVWVDGFVDGELLAFARWVVTTRAVPALFVFTDSDERAAEREPDHRGLSLERLAVGPLSPDETVRLVLAFGPVDQATAVRIADRAAGFPRLAVEILRSLAASGALRRTASGWKARRDAALPVPAGPRALGERRLDDVVARVPRSLPALAVAAVLGMEATVDEWHAVCRHAKILVPAELVPTLLRLRLLRAHDGAIRQTQPALLDAASARTEARHPALHRAAAEVLIARGATRCGSAATSWAPVTPWVRAPGSSAGSPVTPTSCARACASTSSSG
jgi:hypothetical protein